MKKSNSSNTAACPEYEEFLKQCQDSLEIWEQRRDEICSRRLAGTKKGGDLLGLHWRFEHKTKM